jgi:hypothetical protein
MNTPSDTAPATVSKPVNPDTASDVVSDPAKDDTQGQDWSDEGGATPTGPATATEEG